MSGDPGYLPKLSTREQYIDHLEGYALPSVDELEERRLRRPLVKTYMLETVAHGRAMPALETLFSDGIRLDRIDDSLFRVHDREHEHGVVALLEALDDRHPVLYTTLDVKVSDRWVHRAVDTNPWLDRLWLSSPILYELWRWVQRTTPAHRYVRLGFEHEAWYEAGSIELAEDNDDASPEEVDDENSSVTTVERRRSRVQLTERLGVLDTKLPQLVELYDPLNSLVQLQIPAPTRGGHFLHFDGKATNRSDSFLEHRDTVGLVISLYRRLTETAEEQLWIDAEDDGIRGVRLDGAPLLIRFGDPVDQPTFERFLSLGLQRRTSRFRISGYLQRLGPTKAHLSAIDRHLWQPLLLEATAQHLLAVLPRGTCGNSVHRLVTNVQRFLSPQVDVWLGSTPYRDLVAASLGAAA